MDQYGFVKVSLISPMIEVGNPIANVNEMLSTLEHNPAQIAIFPELGLCGYTCGDLFFHRVLFDDLETAMKTLLSSNTFPGLIICGMPLIVEEMVLNTALVIQGKRILGVVPKFYLPSTKEYYEKRWFKSGFDVVGHIKEITYLDQRIPFGNLIFAYQEMRFGIEICEDMWATITPGNLMSVNGANVIINISASNETLGKKQIRRNAVLEHSRKNCGIYVYCSAGASESTSDTVYSGHNIVAAAGNLISEIEAFALESKMLTADLDILKVHHERRNNSSFRDSILKYRFDYQLISIDLPTKSPFTFTDPIDRFPFVPKNTQDLDFQKLAHIQSFSLAKRLKHLGIRNVLIGVSGGLDSALALIVAAKAFDILSLEHQGIIAVSMPALATSAMSNDHAQKLIKALGLSYKEIDLKDHVLEHLDLIGHDRTKEDITYENAQARSRTMVLMNLANQYNGIVLGTGDLSEIALGWSTYNGDQMSMYNVNAGIPKTLVRFMIQKHAETTDQLPLKHVLEAIIASPITPELKHGQTTEAIIGKYEINDFILYRFLACGDNEERIRFLLHEAFDLEVEVCERYTSQFFKRFFSQQFKRQANPDGPKILDVSLSSRTDFRMPSDIRR
ncbi:MAG: NAD(+) synthase [Candidatus Izemoplasmatales bacterium]|nr:NAD(+) synthase [Candidatus Izemoplasmatales bacterium]